MEISICPSLRAVTLTDCAFSSMGPAHQYRPHPATSDAVLRGIAPLDSWPSLRPVKPFRTLLPPGFLMTRLLQPCIRAALPHRLGLRSATRLAIAVPLRSRQSVNSGMRRKFKEERTAAPGKNAAETLEPTPHPRPQERWRETRRGRRRTGTLSADADGVPLNGAALPPLGFRTPWPRRVFWNWDRTPGQHSTGQGDVLVDKRESGLIMRPPWAWKTPVLELRFSRQQPSLRRAP